MIKKRKVRTKAQYPQPGPAQLGLSPREVCAVSGMGLTTVREAIKSGLLPARRIGKKRQVILRADVEAFLQNLPAHAAEAR
ncbi:helix-turn-helix domain-containing protein [Bradyrhizobium sp. SZCCHNS1054]|uniref:helix-turn-helix domain-containing protein n=1 Tax=Bradyrhizobium sp. SZCCHNS1054 TaxID=3057301 RepID=UPI002916BD68|nr:helix-turn-helix domain-containing protein [Bradyrhizobium sp. SZCCHNS1054]